MDPDTEDAARAHQQELEMREQDELIARIRKETSGFRKECDEFSATFNQAVMAIGKSNASRK